MSEPIPPLAAPAQLLLECAELADACAAAPHDGAAVNLFNARWAHMLAVMRQAYLGEPPPPLPHSMHLACCPRCRRTMLAVFVEAHQC